MADDLNDASRFYRFILPPPQLDSPVPRPGPYLFHGAGVQNQFSQYSQSVWIDRIAIFRRILLVWRDIKCILGKNCLLLRIDIAKISTREVIKNDSSPAWNVRTFVIWIVWVSRLNSGSNFFRRKQMLRFTSKRWSVNKHLVRMCSLLIGLVKTQQLYGYLDSWLFCTVKNLFNRAAARYASLSALLFLPYKKWKERINRKKSSWYGRPSLPKIQGCQIDQQIQSRSKDQLQDSIANKGMAWPNYR